MTEPDLSVILINYNSLGFTRACVESLLASEGARPEIIVVDNCSDDDLEPLQKAYPQVRYVLNRENRGFTGGNNDGVNAANGEYILILNNDTVVRKDALALLRDALGRENGRTVVCGYVEDGNGRPQPSCGRFPTLLSEYLRLGVFNYRYIPFAYYDRFTVRTWEWRVPGRVDWCTGAFFAMRRDFFNELGGFDENIFMYMDDVDLHYRVRERGGGVIYHPGPAVTHFGGTSAAALRGKAVGHQYRSTVYYFRKHRGAAAAKAFRAATKTTFCVWLLLFAVLNICTLFMVSKLREKARLSAILLGA